jgi:chromosome segregation ATPase
MDTKNNESPIPPTPNVMNEGKSGQEDQIIPLEEYQVATIDEQFLSKKDELLNMGMIAPKVVHMVFNVLKCAPETKNEVAKKAWDETKEFFGDLLVQVQYKCRFLSEFYEHFDYAEKSVEQIAHLLEGAQTLEELSQKVTIALPQITNLQITLAQRITEFNSQTTTKPEVCKEYLKKLVPSGQSETLFKEWDEEISKNEAKIAKLNENFEKELQAAELKQPRADEARLCGVLTKIKNDEDVVRLRIREAEDEMKSIERLINETNETIAKDQKDLGNFVKNQTEQMLQKRQELENAKRGELQALRDQNNQSVNHYNDLIANHQGEMANAVERKQVTESHTDSGYWWWWGRHSWTETKTITIDKTNEIRTKIASAKERIQEADQRLETMSRAIEQTNQARLAKLDQDIRSLKDSATGDNQAKAQMLQTRLSSWVKSKAEVEARLASEKDKLSSLLQQKTENTSLHQKQSEIVKGLEEQRQNRVKGLQTSIGDAIKTLQELMTSRTAKLEEMGCKNTAHAIALSQECLALCEELQYYQIKIGDFIGFAQMFQTKIQDQIKRIEVAKETRYPITDSDITSEDVSTWCDKVLKMKRYEECREFIAIMVSGETVADLIDNPELAAEYGVPANDVPFAKLWKSKWNPVISRIHATKASEIIDHSIKGLREIFEPVPQKVNQQLKSAGETKALPASS